MDMTSDDSAHISRAPTTEGSFLLCRSTNLILNYLIDQNWSSSRGRASSLSRCASSLQYIFRFPEKSSSNFFRCPPRRRCRWQLKYPWQLHSSHQGTSGSKSKLHAVEWVKPVYLSHSKWEESCWNRSEESWHDHHIKAERLSRK